MQLAATTHRTNSAQEPAVISHIPHPTSQTYALKSGGGYARLTNDYTQRESEGAPCHGAPETGVFVCPVPMVGESATFARGL